ncbi:nucleolar protein 12-domain-containing protein [Neurospora tetraspora]|uniref:Nucleolar protein 12-domain-containing protein n=1 Tax=Neurospora tetraspora TaxID=94610 RepID=A0AAE0JKD8_9PEZI|nr:nucleolar protein 12-domain-containing protein [Neurospora tetraspora]
MERDPAFFAAPRPKKEGLIPPPKKRKTVHKVEEITFDKDARTEYLTGFHKRKQARIKAAKAQAEEEARLERIRLRKQIREERQKNLEEHIQTVHKLLHEAERAGTDDKTAEKKSDDEWDGISEDEVAEEPALDVEEEYIDEDRYTTVTVEAVSVDRDGIHKPRTLKDEEDSETEKNNKKKKAAEEAAQQEADKKSKRNFPEKKKKRKFTYESRHDRNVTERKQRAKKAKRS